MGNIFGRKEHRSVARRKAPPITDKDKAILDLKLKRDEIQRCVQRHEYQMENQKRAAKELLQAGKKDRALLILKKKRLLENLINKSLDQLSTLEKMASFKFLVYSVEEAAMQATVVEGLKVGNEALKQINQIFSVDEVEKIMEETREAAEYQEEISRIMENSGTQLTETDMEEINAELEGLTGAETEDLQFPAVPAEPFPAKGEQEKPSREKEERQQVVLEAV